MDISDRAGKILLVVGVLGLGVAGFLALLWSRPGAEASESPSGRVRVAVAPVEVRRDARLPVRGEGIVRPRVEVGVAARVAGEVREVHPAFVSGGRVDKGERLLQLDGEDERNRLRQARATVAQRSVDARLAAGDAQAAQATIDRLAGSGLEVPPRDDPAGELVARVPQQEAAQAALDAARAQLDNARLALQRTTIEAPFDAVVRAAGVGVGSYVAPGQRIGTLIPADYVEIDVALSSREADRIPSLFAQTPDAAPSEQVAATVERPGADEATWEGALHRAELGVDPQARTVTAVVRVPDPFDEPPLLVGQIVTVELQGRRLDEVVVVTPSAVRWAEGARLWTVAPPNDARSGPVLRSVDVEVLYEGPSEVWVRADRLSTETRVVTSPLAAPRDGQPAQIVDDGRGS